LASSVLAGDCANTVRLGVPATSKATPARAPASKNGFCSFARFNGALPLRCQPVDPPEVRIAAIMARPRCQDVAPRWIAAHLPRFGAPRVPVRRATPGATITVCPPARKALKLEKTETERRWRLLYHLTRWPFAAVVVVLVVGLWNLTRGTSPNLSQKLMRWRVGLQFLAIVIIMLFVLVHNM
jgi:hypothetical protein